MSTTIADMLVKYTADISDVSTKMSTMKSEMSSVAEHAQQTGETTSGGFMGAAKGLLHFGSQIGSTVFGLQGLASAAIGFGSALIGPNASMEQTTVGFESLLGKGKATQDFLQQLNQFAATTPFEFPELATAAQHMLAFGFTTKEVLPTLTDIGDAMSSMGKSTAEIESVINVFGQMKAAGKVNAQDMMQLTTQGIPAWKFLAEAMHKTIPEVQDLSSKGLLPADQAIQNLTAGMHKMFGGGMSKQATTFVGIMSTLHDNITAAMRSFTGPLFELAKSGLEQLANLVSSKAFSDFVNGTAKGIADAFSRIGHVVKDEVTPAWKYFSQLFLNIKENGNPLTPLFMNLQLIFRDVGRILKELSPSFRAFSDLLNRGGSKSALVGVVDALNIGLTLLTDTTAAILKPLDQFAGWLEKGGLAAEIFKDAIIGITVALTVMKMAAFVSSIASLIEILPLVAGLTWLWVGGLTAAAVEMVIATWPIFAIGAAITALVVVVLLAVNHWGEIVKWLQGAWGNVVKFFQGVWDGIVRIFTPVGRWFQDRWTEAASGISKAWSGIGKFFGDAWTQVKKPFEGIGPWFQSRGKDAGEGFKNAQKGIEEFGQKSVEAFKWLYDHNYYVKNTVDTANKWVLAGAKFLTETWNNAVKWVTDAWKWLSDQASSAWKAVSDTVSRWVSVSVKWVQDRWNEAMKWLGDRWNDLAKFADRAWHTIYDPIAKWVSQAIRWIGDQWNAGIRWLSDRWNELSRFADSAWRQVSRVFGGIWDTYIGRPLGDAWRSVQAWFKQMGDGAWNAGLNFMKMIADGFASGMSYLGDAFHNAIAGALKMAGFHDIPGWVGHADGILNSPTGHFAMVGERGPEMMYVPAGASIFPHGRDPRPVSTFASSGSSPYPIKPSPLAVQQARSAQFPGAAQGSGQTLIFQIDSREMARMVNTATDKEVTLKLHGNKGRAA